MPLVSPGLLVGGGIGEGLKSFADSYLKAKGMQNEEKLNRAKLGLLAAQQGRDYDAESGSMPLNEMGQAKQSAELSGFQTQAAQNQQALRDLNESLDRDSDYAKNLQGLGKAYMGVIKQSSAYKKNPDYFAGIEQGLTTGSPHTITQTASHPLLKDIASGVAGEDRVNAMLQGMMIRAGAGAAKASAKDEEEYQKGLLQNPAYKEADTAAESADALIDTVRNATKNKTAAASLPTELANFVSKGKRLHTSTIDAFKNPNSDLMTRIRTGIQKSSEGTIPNDVANDIVQYLQSEKASAQGQRQRVSAKNANRYKDIHGSYPKSYHPDENSESSDQSPQDDLAAQARALLQKRGVK